MSGTPELDSNLLAAKEAYRFARFDLAERSCQEILASSPTHLEARSLLGLVAAQTGRPALAIELLSAVLQEDPNSWGLLVTLSILLREQGRFKEALDLRDRALELNPNDGGSHNERGMCLFQMNEPGQAVESFQRAIALDPKVPILYSNLGAALHALDRNEEAKRALRQACALAPNDARYTSSLGKLCLDLGERAEGVELLRRAYEMAPDLVDAALEYAWVLGEEGDPQAAGEILSRAVVRYHDDYQTQLKAGALYAKLGLFRGASAPLLRAMELLPGEVEPYESFVNTKKFTQEDRWIVEQMQRIAAKPDMRDPEVQSIHFCLGKVYDDLGEYESAVRHFVRGNEAGERILRARLGPFDPEVHRTGIDFMIRTCTKEFFESHPARESDSELPILIVGMARSGTTLAEQIISSHSQVAAGGELPFWYEKGRDFYATRHVPSQQEFNAWANQYLRALRKVDPGCSRVTDKNPATFEALGLVHASLPNARIIHCRRNPIDNCLSIYMTRLGPSQDFMYSRENIVFIYRQYMRLAEHWRQVLPPDRFLEIDYETLAADPEPQVRRLIEFCGLEWEDACLEHHRNEKLVSTPSVWQVRQPIYKTSVERWRNYEPWLGTFAELRDVRHPAIDPKRS